VERVELGEHSSLVHNIHVGGNQEETPKPRHLEMVGSALLFSRTNTESVGVGQ